MRRLIQRELEDEIAQRIIDSYRTPVTAVHATAREDKVELSTQ